MSKSIDSSAALLSTQAMTGGMFPESVKTLLIQSETKKGRYAESRELKHRRNETRRPNRGRSAPKLDKGFGVFPRDIVESLAPSLPPFTKEIPACLENGLPPAGSFPL